MLNMYERMFRRSGVLALFLTVALVAAMFPFGSHVSASPSANSISLIDDALPNDAGPEAADMTAGTYNLTFVTGHRVTVDVLADGRMVATIDFPGDDAGLLSYSTYEVGRDKYLIPDDVVHLIPERLDKELFNVSSLIRYGYHDAGIGGTPFIVTGVEEDQLQGAAAAFSSELSLGAVGTFKALNSIAGFAAVTGSDSAAHVAELLVGEGDSLLSGGSAAKVWLDQPLWAQLDESVPVIGAPDAWDAGFDGTGIIVAVLDTGVDGEHPDLADRIVMERNFTDSDTVSDRQGHGTHVAGTIAGTGAASDGLYKGVAPGAQIMNGKVLDDSGSGPTSGVIAGAEWAAENGAHIVNMSLGGAVTDGSDPLSVAIGNLSEEHGTLFVVSAGNNYRDRSISSPGSAPAALTVGGVDNNRFLAPFSSRGPRIGDFGIKPDVTAPGVGITAARAGESEGEGYYIPLNGTSMASPHVAGMAALLAQKYEDFTWEELKALITSTARPNPGGYTVYQEGAGTVDAVRALETSVLATPSVVQLGYFKWPHGEHEGTSAQIEYRNFGDEEITLELSLNVRNLTDDSAVDPAMLSLSTDSIVIAPGGTETVTLELDPNAGTKGLYGGHVSASIDGEETYLQTLVGFYKEPEVVELTITGISKDGRTPFRTSVIDVISLEDREIATELGVRLENGKATLRVPPGPYSIWSRLFSTDPARPNFAGDMSFLGFSEIWLSEDMELVLDASELPLNTAVIEGYPEAERLEYGYGYSQTDSQGERVSVGIGSNRAVPVYTGPGEEPSIGTFTFFSHWRMAEPDPERSSYVIEAVFVMEDELESPLEHFLSADELAQYAKHDVRVYSDVDFEREYQWQRHHFAAWEELSTEFGKRFYAPTTRVDYLAPGRFSRWSDKMYAPADNPRLYFENYTRTYSPGELFSRSWAKQPLVAGAAPAPVLRKGNTLPLELAEVGDSAGNHAYIVQSSEFRFYRDGELIQTAARPRGQFPMVAESAEYRLELDVDLRDRGGATLSPEASTAWTFVSERSGADEELVPLMDINYDIDLNLNNTFELAGKEPGDHVIRLAVGHQRGFEGAPIADAKLWVSGDDGETWVEAQVEAAGEGQFTAILDGLGLEDGNGFVSLKAEAWDEAGNGIEQEIMRAYKLTADAGLSLVVEEPEDGMVTKDETVEVSGFATDTSGSVTVTVNGREVAVEGDGSFYTRELLDEGENTITVEAVSESGETASVVRTVVADWTPPVIGEIEPADDVVLEWGETVTISFTSKPGLAAAYQIMTSGTEGAGSDGGVPGTPFEETTPGVYTAEYEAPQGAAFEAALIVISARDEAGNMAQAEAEGRLTVKAPGAAGPQLVITEPEEGFLTNRDAVRVSGTATDEAGIKVVTVNGREAAVDGEGNFTTRVILDEGENIIEVFARNASGGETVETVTITADWTPPAVAGMEPADDVTLAPGESITIRFTSEPGLEAAYQISVTGEQGTWYTRDLPVRGTPFTEVADGVYEAEYTAPASTAFEGAYVRITAKDEAGNITITTAPGLLTVVE